MGKWENSQTKLIFCQCALLIEPNERNAEAAASDHTVWSRKQIGHAKPAPL